MFQQHAPLGAVALRLQGIVKSNPGIHFRALGRAAGVSSVGQLRHHIDRLQHDGLVVEVPEGRFKRFFASGQHEPKLRPALARFARHVPRLVGRLLLRQPMNRTELRRTLGLADSTLGYHLARMVRLGDLVKDRGNNRCTYSLADPDLARQVFQHAGPFPEPPATSMAAPAMEPPQAMTEPSGDPMPPMPDVGAPSAADSPPQEADPGPSSEPSGSAEPPSDPSESPGSKPPSG